MDVGYSSVFFQGFGISMTSYISHETKKTFFASCETENTRPQILQSSQNPLFSNLDVF